MHLPTSRLRTCVRVSTRGNPRELPDWIRSPPVIQWTLASNAPNAIRADTIACKHGDAALLGSPNLSHLTSSAIRYRPPHTSPRTARPQQTAVRASDYEGHSLWNAIWCFFCFFLSWFRFFVTVSLSSHWHHTCFGLQKKAPVLPFMAFNGFAHRLLIEKLQCLV